MLKMLVLAAGAATALAFVGPAAAADYEVQMLTRGATGNMVFEPAYLKIEPGDTVTFKSVQPSHNAETIKGMLPAGAEPFKSPFSKDYTVTFEKDGLYGYKCAPHYGLGMVGLIEVGDGKVNAAEAKAVRHPGKANKNMADLFEKSGKAVAAAK